MDLIGMNSAILDETDDDGIFCKTKEPGVSAFTLVEILLLLAII